MDKDANTCANMLGAVIGSNKEVLYSEKKEKIYIPPHLEKYIIPVIS